MVGRRNTKEVLVSTVDSIKKSNELSTAKMNEGLTLNQMQLLSYAIYATQQDGSTTFIKADFERKFGISEYRTEDARKDSQKILSVQAGFEDLENERFKYINVFHEMEYEKGTFTFMWAPKIISHILDLKEKYVLTDLTITANFKSGFSWLLYDYLRGYYGAWYVSFTKEKIMGLFGVEKVKSYQANTGSFKNKVLDVAIAEINEFTELDVKYEEVKKGRSIIGFKIIWSRGKDVRKASSKQKEILKSIADVTLADTLMYAQIENQTNRERAMEIIRGLQAIDYQYISPDVGLTSDKASELVRQAANDLETLNYLLEAEGMDKLKPSEPVPMINWLEDL